MKAIMQKMYLIGIIAGVAAVAIAVAVVSFTSSQPSVNPMVSLAKTTVNYDDTQAWSATGLPPNEGYIATVRWASTAVIVNVGAADARGEAAGSFRIGPTIPPGPVTFRVELASDAATYVEAPMDVLSGSGESSPSIPAESVIISLEKFTVRHDDTQNWSVKGLPPNADYVAAVRFADTALIVGMGQTDANGEAAGSFLIGPNIPPGPVTFRVELASDPTIFAETSMDIPSGSIEISVEKIAVNYYDTQNWRVKGLPPNADYVATIRFADTAVIVNVGTADANGEAADSFLIGPNVTPGTFAFRVELASDAGTFGEIMLTLLS